jgi:hypothetical protein
LEWLASISPKHERELRAKRAREAEANSTDHELRSFVESLTGLAWEWDAGKHPRRGGSPNAGWFASTGGTSGGGKSSADNRSPDRSELNDQPSKPRKSRATPHMLELASVWWQTREALSQARKDLEELPKTIARARSQFGRGGRYAYLPPQLHAKATQDLAATKKLVPELEAQMRELEQQYHASGYDEIPHYAMTPSERTEGGVGIDAVGYAVVSAGSPAGLMPTNIEVDIALTGIGVLKVGKALLSRAASAAPKNVPSQPAALKPYGGSGGGHHIPAKRALEGAPGYNAKRALAMPNEEMARLKVRHMAVSGTQNKLYREFAKTGKSLTWEEMERIEVESLVAGGLDRAVANSTVRKAIEALKKSGVTGPVRIPWGS